MPFIRPLLRHSYLKHVAFVAALAVVTPSLAQAEALLVVEADTGKVLQAENATYPWYPASVTKIMTAYVTLKAVKEGRLTLEQTLTVSPVAASQSPSKMGFKPGTLVTVENALAMMMVKSANDMAVVLAEGVGGSVDGFSAMMNQTAQRLGMTQTSYVNPNGLPADGQVTSARDLAILARAVIRDLPEYEYFMHIPAIRFGRRVTNNFNKLMGRYPGADGFKTGFICASGYNLVASATRNGKRLIAVVLGSTSGQARAVKGRPIARTRLCQQRLWRGCGPRWAPSRVSAPIDASPPNLRDEMCNGKRKRPATDEDADVLTVAGSASSGESAVAFFTAGLQAPMAKASELLLGTRGGRADGRLHRPEEDRLCPDRCGCDGCRKADDASREEVAGRGEEAAPRSRRPSQKRSQRPSRKPGRQPGPTPSPPLPSPPSAMPRRSRKAPPSRPKSPRRPNYSPPPNRPSQRPPAETQDRGASRPAKYRRRPPIFDRLDLVGKPVNRF